MTKNIEDKNLNCVKCGNKAHFNHIINDRGYGSLFDNVSEPTAIPVCKHCNKEYLKQEWFDEPPKNFFKGEKYQHENNILAFLETLDIETMRKVLEGAYNTEELYVL